MPVVETVTIHVDIDTDPAKSQAKIEALFRQMETRAKMAERKLDLYEKKMGDIDKTSNKTAKSIRKTDNAFKGLTRTLKTVGNATGKFLAMFTKFSFIAVAAEIALVSVALLSVKLALVSGRLAIKAYQASLTGLGIAAQGVAVVLGSVAAAMRQINEVTLAPTIGGGKQAAQALRGAMSDRQLSFFGMEGIQEAVNALAKGGVPTNRGYTSVLRQLGNYTADPKELADLAAIYAQAQKAGGVDAGMAESMGAINPTLAAGIEELTESGLASEDIMDALIAGTAEATDAWEGQLGRLNETVMGTLKGMVPRMFQLFADLGQPFLNTIQNTLVSIEDIIRESVFRIRGFVTGFGLENLIPGFLDAFETIADWTVKIMAKAGTMEGWVKKMMSWWDTIRNYFIDMARIFQPLEEGADALIDILKPQFLPVFEGFSMLIRDFADLLVDNKTDFVTFGHAIGGVFEAIFKWFGNANEAFADALPIWTDFANMVARDIVPLLGDIFNMMHEASQTVLPVVTKALSAVAGALSVVAQALTSIMSVPGIGQLLGLPMAAMMFKTTRAPLMAGAAAAGFGRKASTRTGGGIAGKLGIGAAAGSAAFGSSLMKGGLGQLLQVPATSAGGGLGSGTALALGQLTTLGAGLASAAPGALMGVPIGTAIGDRVGGAGGLLAGTLGAAGVGAGLGAAVGAPTGIATPITAIIGGIAGAVTGFFSTKSAQKRVQDLGKADELADAMMKDFYYNLNMNLSQGQGMSALIGARTEMEEMLLGVEETARETGVREHDLRMRLNNERRALDVQIESREDSYKRRIEDLSRITGIAAEDIAHMADVTGTDLSDAVTGVADQMVAIGAIDPWRNTREGVQDTTNQLLYENLFGPGSLYARETVAPEMADTLNALLDDATAQYERTGEVDGGLVREIIEQQMAYTQTAYGLTGMDLGQSLKMDLGGRLDEFAGTGETFQKSMPDLVNVLEDWKDPMKNPAVATLRAELLDYQTNLAQYTQADETPAQIAAAAETAFQEAMAGFTFEGDWTGYDEALVTMIEATKMNLPLDAMSAIVNLLVDDMGLLETEFASLAAAMGWVAYPIPGSEEPTPMPKTFSDPGAVDRGRHGTSRSPGPTGGAYGRRPGSTPSTVAKVTAPISVSQSSSSRFSANVTVNGPTDPELAQMIIRMIRQYSRSTSQRTPTSLPGRSIFVDYG